MADALASMREVASYSPAVSMARLLEQIDDVPPPGYLPKASRLARVARPGGEHWSCCPASVPAASRDQLGVSPNARRSSPGASPSTRTIFSPRLGRSGYVRQEADMKPLRRMQLG